MPASNPEFDLVISGAEVVTPERREVAEIGISNGRIAAIQSSGLSDRVPVRQVLKANGLTVLPGVIDSQVHFREPGLEHKEDLESGTRGAVLGGVTTVFEMPNTKPSTTSAELFRDKLKRAQGRVWTNAAFYIGAANDNADMLGQLELESHCCGVKVFMGSSYGSLLVAEDVRLADVLRSGRRRVIVHAEDEARLIERKHLAIKEAHPRAHPIWRDTTSALLATQRLLRLAREAGRRVHVLHISTADEVEFLRQNQDIATAEVLPQHLTLSAPECYERFGTLAQMNPPIRDAHHQAGLWRGVQDRILKVIGSDHAPHTAEEKAQPYPQSPSGLTGVQTLVPLMLNHVAHGRLSLEHFVEMTSRNPARIFGALRKGEIALGYDADLTIVDLKRTETIQNSWIESKSKWTPFDGMQVRGWPVHTVVRGHLAVRDGQLAGQPKGTLVEFDTMV
jgi:dihydroorotase